MSNQPQAHVADERYCLACAKVGHRTDECWSTHGINTPPDRELFRLVRATLDLSAEKRKSLELQRVYDERGLQIGRLEVAVRRAIAAGAPAETSKQVEPFHYYGLSAEELQQLLDGSLKPEEMASTDEGEQHSRVGELVRWFARFTQGNVNPKWATRHACELAYFIATNGINRSIDLSTIKQAAFREGVNITPEDRGTLERIGFAQPAPAPATDARNARDAARYHWLRDPSGQKAAWQLEAMDKQIDAAMLSANSPREAG